MPRRCRKKRCNGKPPIFAAASHSAMSSVPIATHRSPCPPGFSPVIIAAQALMGSTSPACRRRGANRSRIRPLWANRPSEEKPYPVTGLPARTTSVVRATMLVVRPPDGIVGSRYREMSTDFSRISTMRIRTARVSGVVRPVQPVEALGEVGLQILDVLEADMDAQQVLAVRPRHGGAVLVGMGRDHQAFVAAPARAHAEDVHAVQHRRQRILAVAVAQR